MKKTNPMRILIADDHPVVREGLVALINRRPDMLVVAEVSNGQEAVEQFLRHRPDIALLDLRMPGMDGVDAIAAIREKIPTARLIVLTTFDGEEDIYRGLRAGAKAYLLKDAPRDELLTCIRQVHEGQTVIPPAIAAKLADRLTTSGLTRREIQVLRLVADGMGNKEIAAELSISEGTAKTHVSSILTKLDASDRTQAVTIALRRGILRL
jgi:two-component system, NarL family, response regulator